MELDVFQGVRDIRDLEGEEAVARLRAPWPGQLHRVVSRFSYHLQGEYC